MPSQKRIEKHYRTARKRCDLKTFSERISLFFSFLYRHHHYRSQREKSGERQGKMVKKKRERQREGTQWDSINQAIDRVCDKCIFGPRLYSKNFRSRRNRSPGQIYCSHFYHLTSNMLGLEEKKSIDGVETPARIRKIHLSDFAIAHLMDHWIESLSFSLIHILLISWFLSASSFRSDTCFDLCAC